MDNCTCCAIGEPIYFELIWVILCGDLSAILFASATPCPFAMDEADMTGFIAVISYLTSLNALFLKTEDDDVRSECPNALSCCARFHLPHKIHPMAVITRQRPMHSTAMITKPTESILPFVV